MMWIYWNKKASHFFTIKKMHLHVFLLVMPTRPKFSRERKRNPSYILWEHTINKKQIQVNHHKFNDLVYREIVTKNIKSSKPHGFWYKGTLHQIQMFSLNWHWIKKSRTFFFLDKVFFSPSSHLSLSFKHKNSLFFWFHWFLMKTICIS